MLTQDHTLEWIQVWLSQWIIWNDSKKAHEIVMDESAAIMGAVVGAFTRLNSTNDYLTACMDSLQNKSLPPECFIRIDRSHFVASIKRNVKKGFQKTVKLIHGVLGYLITCDNFPESARIVHALFTIVINEFNSAAVTESVRMLRNLILTHDVSTLFEEVNETEIDEAKIKTKTYKGTLNYQWVQSILKTVELAEENCESGCNENMYFAPDYKKYLIRTFVRMPLWSNIMLNTFKSENTTATSSSVENVFKEIKFLLGLNKKKRADVFLRHHLKCLSGHLKNGLADQKVDHNTQSMKPKKRRRSIDSTNNSGFSQPDRAKRSLSCERLNSESYNSDEHDTSYICDTQGKRRIVENWRNKMKSADATTTTNRRSNYSILEKHDPEYQHRNIRVLINGYKTGKLKTIHTCAFDSIYSILAVACVDYDSIATKYTDAKCELSQFLKEIVKGRKADEKICYRIRNSILDTIFSSESYEAAGNIKIDTKTSKFIDCMTGIGTFFSNLVKVSNENFSSFTENVQCPSCDDNVVLPRALVPLRLSSDFSVNMAKLTDHIIHQQKFRCDKCNVQKNVIRTYNDLLAFEVEPPREIDKKKYALSEIENPINVDTISYDLIGAIQFEVAHFTALVKRANGTWESYDDNPPKIRKTGMHVPRDIFMLFYKRGE